jgi:hypothetical protein
MAKRRRRWQIEAQTATQPPAAQARATQAQAGQRRDSMTAEPAPASSGTPGHASGPVQRLWLLLVRLDRAVWRSMPTFREGRAAARSWEDAAKLVLQAQMAIGGLTRDLPTLPSEDDVAAARLVDSARDTLAEVDEMDPHGWRQTRELVVEALDASEVVATA